MALRFWVDRGVAFDLNELVLSEFCVFAAHQSWSRKAKGFFFCCFFLIFPVCYSHVWIVKGRVNVINECLSGQMGLNLRLPSEAPEASYLWKAKHKDTPWGNKMLRKAPCLHLWSQFHFISHPNLITVSVAFWWKSLDTNKCKLWRSSTWLNCHFWTCWICSEQRWSLGLAGGVVHGDGLFFFSFFSCPICFFVCIPLIPCNSTLFYLKKKTTAITVE